MSLVLMCCQARVLTVQGSVSQHREVAICKCVLNVPTKAPVFLSVDDLQQSNTFPNVQSPLRPPKFFAVTVFRHLFFFFIPYSLYWSNKSSSESVVAVS